MRFLHTKKLTDLTKEYAAHRQTIILADGVINSGKMMIEFVNHIRSFDKSVQIVMLVGVFRADCIENGPLKQLLVKDLNLWLVGLRCSDNTYTGLGGCDTGHRLFKSTFLD